MFLCDYISSSYTFQVKTEVQGSTHSVTAAVDWLSHRPNINIVKYDVYAINGYTFRTKQRECKGYQNSGVSVVATDTHISKEAVTYVKTSYYGVLQEIWVLDYNFKRIPIFMCDWVDNKIGVKQDKLGYTLVDLKRLGHKGDPFILASQAQQVFYVADPLDPKMSVVFKTPSRNYRDVYDDVDEEFSTVVSPTIDNIMPRLDPVDLNKENDYFRTDCQGIIIRNKVCFLIKV